MPLRFYPAIFFLLVISLTLSCKKDSPSPALPDDITFHEFDPNVSISSVDSFYHYSPYDCGNFGMPYPLTGIDTFELDINQDSITDFIMEVNHWVQFQSNTSPCDNYHYQMSILGTDNVAEIAIDGDHNNAHYYLQDEPIEPNASQKWDDFGGLDTYFTSLSGTRYIGLRVKNGSSYNYAWLKLKRSEEPYHYELQLLSYGYNKTVSNSILAGQEH